MTVGERIKFQREHIGMSQEELGQKIGVRKQTIYKYENNIVTNITSDRIEAICDALGTSPMYIMGWSENLTEENASSIPDFLSDKKLVESMKKLQKLNKKHKQTVYDTIDYWYEKEGH